MLAEIDEGFVALDWQYRYTYVNPAACRLLEHTTEEILGHTPCELWPEYAGHEVEAAYRAAMELGRSAIIEYETAGHHFFEERLYPTTVGLSVYFRNIDERRRKEAEREALLVERQRSALEGELARGVQRERQRLYDVLETLPAMICLLSPDYHVAFANRAFREQFGEPQGRHCYEQCFGEQAPCGFCESFRPLETGEPHHWQVTTPSGTVVAAYDYPFSDVDGSPLVLEMEIDITEATRNETALRELTATLEAQARVAEATEKLRAAAERYAFLIEHTHTLMVQIDFRGPRFVSVNDYLCSFTGYSREELLDMNPLDFLNSSTAHASQNVCVAHSPPPGWKATWCFASRLRQASSAGPP